MTTTPREEMLAAALQYAAKGWPVFPIHSVKDGRCSCGNKGKGHKSGKHPRTQNGLKDATTNPKIIEEWFDKWPDCNIDIRTDPESELDVLHIDGFNSLEILECKHGKLPNTLIAQTGGGGRHYFFRYPEGGFKNSAGEIAPGIDTRGNGGYIVASPSVHESGRGYCWQDSEPGEIELAEVPPWLLELLNKLKQATLAPAAENGTGKINEGCRNNALASMTGKMRHDGFEQSAIEVALLEYNEEKCSPPLPKSEVKKIAASISNYETGNKERAPTQAEILIKLTERADFFHDAENDAYATVQVEGHRENWRVRSKGFRIWLLNEFYEATEKAPSSQALADALGILEAKSRFRGEERKTFVRVGEADGAIFIDLCDKDWQAVEITPSGWRVIADPHIKFVRSKGMSALPVPVVGSSVEELMPFVNIEKHEWPLVVGFLVGALKPTGPFPILVLQGEQGSAKSTFARLLRSLVDPSTTPLRTIPREERDLLISAKNSWCGVFDNLSGLAPQLSDSLCRLSTGGGLATRKLYSDSEETLFDSQRPLILNGIDNLTTRGDLRDRALILNLPVIHEKNRRDEKALSREFEAVRPRVFGALLNAVSCALKNEGTVKLETMPRMADFAKWVVAAEPELGWKSGTFIAAYKENISAAVEFGIENDPIGKLSWPIWKIAQYGKAHAPNF